MRRSLVQNLVPGATTIFVVRSYLKCYYAILSKMMVMVCYDLETLIICVELLV